MPCSPTAIPFPLSLRAAPRLSGLHVPADRAVGVAPAVGGVVAAYLGLAAASAMPLLVDGQRVRLPRSAAELVQAHPLLEVSSPPGPAEWVGSPQPGRRRAFTRDLLRQGPERLGDLWKVSQQVHSARTQGLHLHSARSAGRGARAAPHITEMQTGVGGGPSPLRAHSFPSGRGGGWIIF